ncbi:MAG: PA2169 family four-helix-bundle protein [Pseudomonadota bacterium]
MNNIELLKDLTQATYDSVEGYRQAAETAEKSAFKKAFERRRDMRAKTLQHLNNAMLANSQPPITSTSVQGETHQLFLTLTDTFADGDKAVIARVEEGERYLANKFESALADESGVLPGIRVTLQEAYRDISEGENFSAMLKEEFA